ncbi:helix-turn-helix domain-containing protein [Saccharopolyspora sp. HNM0983]|uniref:Helix-turn-helix domain-containing protein n=1 Tax=Saccharopolyspora montiporae TaxID=2781240 RepID=A0A929FYW5_9PSEU|nr:helix-turn-helix transcriptional regulator [Saccharopolyspora sp. HNM0983]MBE9373132.1 helix-turn-helix domain-containing protein [Saccharopolyspora sp. HNM0983]
MNTWPAVRRVQVGLTLRSLREQAGVRPKDVAERLDWYPNKVTRVEKGELIVSAAEVEELLRMFDVSAGEDADRLRVLAREARKRDRPARVPDWAATFVALEGAAAEIKYYDPEVVPPIFQTEDYTRAVLSHPLDDTVDVEPAIAERMQRADRALLAKQAPEVMCVLGEATLYRAIGGKHVLRGQLQHLRWVAARPNVTLQILPFDSGEHVALGTSWTVLHLAEPVATFVYTESLVGSDYFDKPSQTGRHLKAFDILCGAASSDRTSVDMLDRRIDELT